MMVFEDPLGTASAQALKPSPGLAAMKPQADSAVPALIRATSRPRAPAAASSPNRLHLHRRYNSQLERTELSDRQTGRADDTRPFRETFRACPFARPRPDRRAAGARRDRADDQRDLLGEPSTGGRLRSQNLDGVSAARAHGASDDARESVAARARRPHEGCGHRRTRRNPPRASGRSMATCASGERRTTFRFSASCSRSSSRA